MSSFDKFMKDLEKRQQQKREARERLANAEQHHSIRDRVKLYAERWQNSVRAVRKKK